MSDKVFVLMHDGACCGVFGDYRSVRLYMACTGLTFDNSKIISTSVIVVPAVECGSIFKDL